MGEEVKEEIAAIEWIHAFMLAHVGEFATLGFRWLLNAQRHLEDRVEDELRRER